MPKPVIVPATRPTGISVLAGLYALIGVLAIVGGGVVISLLGGLGAGAAEFEGLIVVIGLISFVIAYGLWTGMKWAWWLALIIGILLILSFALFDVVGGFIGLYTVFYLPRNTVKAWFSK
jgi:lysylphosphatidylglycerol synthetase-like protein (DUF2156 family)